MNFVAAIGVDGCFGDEAAKNISACTPSSFVIGGHGHMFTTTGLLIVKHGGKSYQIENYLYFVNVYNYATNHIVFQCLLWLALVPYWNEAL